MPESAIKLSIGDPVRYVFGRDGRSWPAFVTRVKIDGTTIDAYVTPDSLAGNNARETLQAPFQVTGLAPWTAGAISGWKLPATDLIPDVPAVSESPAPESPSAATETK